MDIIISNPADPAMWTIIGTIAQGIATIMAIAALIYSMTSFRQTLQASHYTELDSMYFELLKLALEKPHLNSGAITRSGDQLMEYDIYAFMVWNFIEAIHDRCGSSRQLCATWYPVIDTEHRKHRAWLDHEDNRHKFKPAFHDFIRAGSFTENATAGSG